MTDKATQETRYTLTEKAYAALGTPAPQVVDQSSHPGHHITVTGGGPFGRAYFDCTCGIARTFASKHAATVAAMAHHERLVHDR